MNRVAIMIDGAFYLNQLPRIRQDVDIRSAEAVVRSIRQLVRGHLRKLASIQQTTFYKPDNRNREFVLEPNWYSQHYRTFYFDAPPLGQKIETPIKKDKIILSQTNSYQFRIELFRQLRKERNLALRLGELKVSQHFMWQLRASKLLQLLAGEIQVSDLKDKNFIKDFRQKGVDMRLGLDMASIALKKQANVFVLVTGDADFVPAAKLVRREGCQVILDPLWKDVPAKLHEHIDGLESGFTKNQPTIDQPTIDQPTSVGHEPSEGSNNA